MHHRRLWICVFLFTLTLINYTDRVALSVAVTPISTEFHLTKVEMGYLLSSFLWMYLVCLLPVGLLVDRFGGKVVNAAGIGIWSIATVLTGFTTGFVSMAATRIVMGMGESTSWPACNRVIREWFPASERGFANAVFGAGAAAGAGDRGGAGIGHYRVARLARGLLRCRCHWLSVACRRWLIAFDKPDRVGWLRTAERDRILSERDGQAAHAAAQPASPLLHLLTLRSVWGLFLTQGCEVYGGYMLLTWLPNYLQTAKGLSVLNAGMLTAVPFGAATVIAVVLGVVSDRLLSRDAVHAGRRRTMLAVMMVSAASILLIPFIDDLWLIVVILAVARSTGAAGSALNFALVTDLVRNPADIGKVTSITVLGGNSFGMMGPIVTGYVVGLTGSFNGTFAVAGILALIGAVATLTMTRRPIEAYGMPLGAAAQPA